MNEGEEEEDIVISQRCEALSKATSPIMDFIYKGFFAAYPPVAGDADFVLGNPQSLPLTGLVDALVRHAVPQGIDHFAYKRNEPASRAVVVASLAARLPGAGEWAPDDVFLTTGNFAGLAVAIGALTEPGDEVAFMTPPWFFYESIVVAQGCVPRKIPIKGAEEGFDLDLEAVDRMVGPRTRIVIVNSPHNPTGAIYSHATLASLGTLLRSKSALHGRPVFIVSDEAYCRVVFDGRSVPSPLEHYEHAILAYTYGKTLLAPGQRIGYLAVSPRAPMPIRRALRRSIVAAQFVQFAFPNALMQHALPELEGLCIDVAELQAKRDDVYEYLTRVGYQVACKPAGTFYLCIRTPMADDLEYTRLLALRHRIYVLPGSVVEMPGYIRVSLTGSKEMFERAKPGFRALFEECTTKTVNPSI